MQKKIELNNTNTAQKWMQYGGRRTMHKKFNNKKKKDKLKKTAKVF